MKLLVYVVHEEVFAIAMFDSRVKPSPASTTTIRTAKIVFRFHRVPALTTDFMSASRL